MTYPDDGFVVITDHNSSRICTGSMSVSSNGAYRVVAQHYTNDTPSNIIYRSSNKGITWEAIEAPNQTADTSVGAGGSPYVVAVEDDGTIHAARMLYTGTGTTTDLWHWKYDGSWTAGHALTTGGTFNYNNDNVQWIGVNGTSTTAGETTATHGAAGAWVMQDVVVNPSGTVLYRDDGNNAFNASSPLNMGILTGPPTPAVGDLLIASVMTKSGSVVTPPNIGWTAITPVIGYGVNLSPSAWFGTNDFKMSTFWKIANSGDIGGTQNWTWTGGGAGLGLIHSYTVGTFNASNPILSTDETHSLVEEAIAVGPPTSGGGGFVVETFASTEDAGGGTFNNSEYTVTGRPSGWSAPDMVIMDYSAPLSGNTIMIAVARQSSTMLVYKSVNDGVNWSTATGTAPSSTNLNAHHIVWIGSYIHFAINIAGSTYIYKRIDPLLNQWFGSTTAPSFPSASTTGIENIVVISAYKSTSELYMGLIDESTSNTDKLYLWKTTDSGENWSTVCSAETLGTAWNTAARAFRSTGLSIGSDDKLHIWGSDKQTSAAYNVYTMTRDYANTGTYGTPQLVGTTPFRGSRAAAATNGNYDHWPVQRQDGIHDRPYDFWGMWYTTSSLSSSLGINELVLVISVPTTIARITYPISDNPPDDDFDYIRNYVPQYPFHDDSVY